MTEQQLIQDCREGVKSSQYLLVRRYASMLLSVCQRYARDEAMAKDVLQEVFLRIFQQIGSYREQGSFEAWMRRIAVRRSLQWLERSCFNREQHPLEMPEPTADLPEVYAALGAEDIMALVHQLPAGFRTVFNLYVVEGYSHKEIASLLGISENTSRSQLVRARKMLQHQLTTTKNESHEVASVRKDNK